MQETLKFWTHQSCIHKVNIGQLERLNALLVNVGHCIHAI
jgi:hypothetical protein